MTINLEVPKKFGMLVNQAHQVSTEIFRPISRRYDQEAAGNTPQNIASIKELDMLASLIDGMNASGETSCGSNSRVPSAWCGLVQSLFSS